MRTATRVLVIVGLVFGLGGCMAAAGDGPEGGDGSGAGGKADDGDGVADDYFPLDDPDTIGEGDPPSDTRHLVRRDGEELPARFTDLVELQTPVRNQQSRGVCSIFSTVGLMEHLYIKGGMSDPDFSEQFLQWSAKTEVGSFPNSSGSNARSNVKAIHQYGIVEEDVWPYVGSKLTHEQCTGDDKPTFCYTHGDPETGMPPEGVLDAERWKLPRGQWLHSNTEELKIHMKRERTGVVVGLDFFYQSWNHGGARDGGLATSNDYQAKGYVTYPNAADKEYSREPDNRAGHSILLLGWDDTLKVQKRDADGNLLFRDGSGGLTTEDTGQPAYDEGFFLIKNSWGTSKFGRDLPEQVGGPGYGWISYDYVDEYGRAYTSSVPDLSDTRGGYRRDEPTPRDIPFEGDSAPAESTVEVDASGTVDSLTLAVRVDHLYFESDLQFWLTAPSGVRVEVPGDSFTLEQEDGRASVWTVSLSDHFAGEEAAGPWTLEVIDVQASDPGTLHGWELRLDAR